MAIYTKLNKEEIKSILTNYDIGELMNFIPIKEGIENTNYKIIVNNKKYILTIYEKRVNVKDLPFFCELTSNLFAMGFSCPLPIENKLGEMISNFNNKKLTILSFIEGVSKEKLSERECNQIGTETAKLHEFTKNMKISRNNSLSINSWKKMYGEIENGLNKIDKKIIKESLTEINSNWPVDLPKGIIHGDIFWDNIIFHNEKVSGIIDYTFACNDFYAYELAICINSLAFDKKKTSMEFDAGKAKSFIEGYTNTRKLSEKEKNSLQILCIGASIRFLMTRLIDFKKTSEEAFVKIKDPKEFLDKLIFFKNNNISEILFS